MSEPDRAPEPEERTADVGDGLVPERMIQEEPAGDADTGPKVRRRRRRRSFPKRKPSTVRTAALIIASVIAVITGFLMSDRIMGVIHPRGPSVARDIQRPAPVQGQAPYTSMADWPAAPDQAPSAATPASTAASLSASTARAGIGDVATLAASVSNNVTGTWTLTTRVDSAAAGSLRNLTRGYRVRLEQRDNRVVGTGYQVSENGKLLPDAARSPVQVDGTIDGNRISITVASGSAGSGAGQLLLYLADDGSMRGRFTGERGGMSGQSQATRERGARD